MFGVESVPSRDMLLLLSRHNVKKTMNERQGEKSAVANRSTKYTQESASKGIFTYLLVSKGKGRYLKGCSTYLFVSVRIVSVHWNASIR